MGRKIAFSGILLSINTILLMLINIIPTNTLFIMAISSFLISIIIMEFGPANGACFYIATIILGFLVITNKLQWVLYALTFGIYGLAKYIIEQDRNIYVEYTLKILFANIMAIIGYFLLKDLMYIPVNIFIIAIFEIAFLVYDHFYSSFIIYYNEKLRKKIKR